MQSTHLKKVILIDDEESFYNILKPKLARLGVILKWAKNAKDGIDLAKKYMPCMVITDIVMPYGNGFDVIKALKEKEETQDIKFVILSSWGETRFVYDEEFLRSLGIQKYLVKSSHTPTEIFQEIKKLMV